MSAAELFTAVVLGVLLVVLPGGMVWSGWCEDRDQAARRARQQRHAHAQCRAHEQQPELWESPARNGRGDDSR